MAIQMPDGSIRCTNVEDKKECGHINPQGEAYCEECGTKLEITEYPTTPAEEPEEESEQVVEPEEEEELKEIEVEVPAPVAPVPPKKVAPPTVKKAVAKAATLSVKDGDEIDVAVGAEIVVARHDSDKCTPDIALVDPRSSSTPITITGVAKGKIRVSDPGSTNGFMVLKYYPGGTMDKPTEVELSIGDTLIIIKQAIAIE